MEQLKIAVLWHQHQPYYKKDSEFILPWVRMHGVKDYYDLAELLNEFPKIRQTFNIVPSMLLQLEQYISGECADTAQKLASVPASELDNTQKEQLLSSFFLCNEQNLILPNERYAELFHKSRDAKKALAEFSVQDWLDLQTWYNLAWFGPFSKEKPAIKRLIAKGRNFTETEKELVLSLNIEVLKQIVPTLTELKKLNQIEISCSPMYHPILPLLCDTNAMRESRPDALLPEKPFIHPEDARVQIENGRAYFQKIFGFEPDGSWPPEGSVSNAVTSLYSKLGFKWIASDEMVLMNSVKDRYFHLDKYFPRKIKTSGGDITMFFRDHQLSDAIGFVYSGWEPGPAVEDFLQKFRNIRHSIFQKYGDEGLRNAVVPVILDGENCWEFYPENGISFLRKLYTELSESNEFRTVTFSESITEESLNFLPPIENIVAGSWINADFNIWLGHSEHREAWSLLSDAKNEIEIKKDSLAKEVLKKANEELYIAEGSDWFWWYGDTHFAPNKYDFDALFRWHLEQIYRLTGGKIPDKLLSPLNESRKLSILTKPANEFEPPLLADKNDRENWSNAGVYNAKSEMSAMHQIGETLESLNYCKSGKILYFRLNLIRQLERNDTIRILLFGTGSKITISGKSFELENLKGIIGLRYAINEDIIIALTMTEYFTEFPISLETQTSDGVIKYPRSGELKLLF